MLKNLLKEREVLTQFSLKRKSLSLKHDVLSKRFGSKFPQKYFEVLNILNVSIKCWDVNLNEHLSFLNDGKQ